MKRRILTILVGDTLEHPQWFLMSKSMPYVEMLEHLLTPQMRGNAGPTDTPPARFTLFDWSGHRLPPDVRIGEIPVPGIVMAIDPRGKTGGIVGSSAESYIWAFRHRLMADEKSGDRLIRYLRSPDAARVPDPLRTIDVFISYSFEDGALASSIVKALTSRGLEVFIAESSLSTGRQWREQIRDAVRSSRAAILLVTKSSVNSTWVVAEAGAFASRRIPTVVLFDGIDAKAIPAPLRGAAATGPATDPERWLQTIVELARFTGQAIGSAGLMRTIFIVHAAGDGPPSAAAYHQPANQRLSEVIQLMFALLSQQGRSVGSPNTYALTDLYSQPLDPAILVCQVPFPGCVILVSRRLRVETEQETLTGDDAAEALARSIAMKLIAQREDENDKVATRYARYIHTGAWQYEPTPVTGTDVGLTYHEQNADPGSRLRSQLEARGLRCAVRVANADGQSSGVDAGRSPVDDARALVVLISEATRDEPWLAYDIGAAWLAGLPVVPVLVGEWSGEPPDILAPYQRLSWDRQQERLVNDLVSLLDLSPYSILPNVTSSKPKPARKSRKRPGKS